jgi:hypothetical protein
MSLLDWGLNETVTVYPEIAVTDADGNTRTKPASTGIVTKARMQVLGQSGTSSRRQEQDSEGYETERVYTIRFPRDFQVLGAQSEIVWNGQVWALFGTENRYNSSPRTRHITYSIKRS